MIPYGAFHSQRRTLCDCSRWQHLILEFRRGDASRHGSHGILSDHGGPRDYEGHVGRMLADRRSSISMTQGFSERFEVAYEGFEKAQCC